MANKSVAEKAAENIGLVHWDTALPNGATRFVVQSATDDRITYTVIADGTETTCDCPSSRVCWHREAVTLWLLQEEEDAIEGQIVEDPQDDDDAPLPSESSTTPRGEAGPPSPASAGGPPELSGQEASTDSDDRGSSSTSSGDAPGLAIRDTDDLAMMMLSPSKVDRDSAWGVMGQLSKTEFVPAALRGKPAAVMGAIFMGAEYGLGPLEALRSIDVIDGSPEPNAEMKLRLYRRAGHQIVAEEWFDDPRGLRLTGKRGDTGEEHTAIYTVRDAERNGKLKVLDDGTVRARSRKDNPLPWETNTDDLLWARAVSRLVRRLASDALDVRQPSTRAT